jgi:hypothetical protein
MCRSAAREGARGPDGEDAAVCPLDARAVGEMIEKSDPSNKVTGYTRRTTGDGGCRGSAGIVVVGDPMSRETDKACVGGVLRSRSSKSYIDQFGDITEGNCGGGLRRGG